MECFAAFLIFATIACWLLASGMGRLSRHFKQRQLLISLAQSFGGTYHSGGIFSRPWLGLRYGPTNATVTLRKSKGPIAGRTLTVTIPWPYSAVHCEISHRTKQDASLDQRRWPVVPFQGDFDRQLEVRSDEPAETAALLTAGTQWQLMRLLHTGGNAVLHILIRDGRIVVQKPWKKSQSAMAPAFVQGALELYDQCMLAKATGIEFLRTDEAQPLQNVICKICGEEIVDRMVVCRRCKTPHHQDCWEYNGTCSIFGCRETTFFLPGKS